MDDLTRYMDYLRFERRVSEHTIVAYTNDLQQFAIFCQKESVASLCSVPAESIREWLISLMENHISTRSINRKISALKSFYRYHLKLGTIEQNPMTQVHAPKMSKRLPAFVAESQMQRLFTDDLFSDDFSGQRDCAIMELFYATGMRLSELIHITGNDLDFEGNSAMVKVLGKRNKERVIPISEAATEAIRIYLDSRAQQFPLLNKNDYLFVTDKGEKLYSKAVYRIVRKYLDAITTIEKRSPHVLRHTFATHLLSHGAPLNDIKEILGHANLAATQVYTHTSVEKLKSIYKQAHPRA